MSTTNYALRPIADAIAEDFGIELAEAQVKEDIFRAANFLTFIEVLRPLEGNYDFLFGRTHPNMGLYAGSTAEGNTSEAMIFETGDAGVYVDFRPEDKFGVFQFIDFETVRKISRLNTMYDLGRGGVGPMTIAGAPKPDVGMTTALFEPHKLPGIAGLIRDLLGINLKTSTTE